jgi:hypothetical protein
VESQSLPQSLLSIPDHEVRSSASARTPAIMDGLTTGPMQQGRTASPQAQCSRANQPWTESSEIMSQNKPLFIFWLISSVCRSAGTLTPSVADTVCTPQRAVMEV